MPRKPEPPKPTTWTIYKVAAKAIWLGTVEAPDKKTAIEKAKPEDADVFRQRFGGEPLEWQHQTGVRALEGSDGSLLD